MFSPARNKNILNTTQLSFCCIFTNISVFSAFTLLLALPFSPTVPCTVLSNLRVSVHSTLYIVQYCIGCNNYYSAEDHSYLNFQITKPFRTVGFFMRINKRYSCFHFHANFYFFSLLPLFPETFMSRFFIVSFLFLP